MENKKIHFITYGNNKYNKAKKRIKIEAEKSGFFNTIKIYDNKDLDLNFVKKYEKILNLKRGGWYWIWKFNIILKRLNEINENDFLIYLDSGCSVNKYGEKKFKEYLKILNDSELGIISFQTAYPERIFTIKEIFEYFKLDINGKISNSGQYIATILIIKKNNHSKKIFKEGLDILNFNPNLITDLYNSKQNKFFIDNRHDQSILSVIRKIHDSIIIKDESWDKNFKSIKMKNIPFWATRHNSLRHLVNF